MVGHLVAGVVDAPNAHGLVDFAPFPFTDPETTVNGSGKIELKFTPLDNFAFSRLESD